VTTAVAAADLGASGGRVMLGVIGGRDQLELHELHRFSNVPVRVLGTLHWDILSLFQGVLDGIAAAADTPSSFSSTFTSCESSRTLIPLM